MLSMLADERIRTVLAAYRTIAVLGAKDKPGQAVDTVGRYLIGAGYTVIPVHPVRRNVWGLQTFASLLDIPMAVNIVNLFRAPRHCPQHAHETLAMRHRPAVFWMQLGIHSPDAGALLTEQHITVIEDACIMVEHQRLMR